MMKFSLIFLSILILNDFLMMALMTWEWEVESQIEKKNQQIWARICAESITLIFYLYF